MPREGWKIITVKTQTKKDLMKVSRAMGVSINDLIASRLSRDKTTMQRLRRRNLSRRS